MQANLQAGLQAGRLEPPRRRAGPIGNVGDVARSSAGRHSDGWSRDIAAISPYMASGASLRW